MAHSILVVEDEIKLCKSLCEYLDHEGYESHGINHGDDVISWFKENNPSMILLDLMLPGKDGITLCRELRQFSDVPIIMLTARTDEIDRLLGLELGADDYLCKPYSLREVVARVKAVLRRVDARANPTANTGPTLQINEANYHVQYDEKNTELTAVEFQLLKALFNQAGRIFSRDALMEKVYNDDRIVSDRTVDSHIKKLRKKLAEIAPDIQFIHSIYGVGYKFDV